MPKQSLRHFLTCLIVSTHCSSLITHFLSPLHFSNPLLTTHYSSLITHYSSPAFAGRQAHPLFLIPHFSLFITHHSSLIIPPLPTFPLSLLNHRQFFALARFRLFIRGFHLYIFGLRHCIRHSRHVIFSLRL